MCGSLRAPEVAGTGTVYTANLASVMIKSCGCRSGVWACWRSAGRGSPRHILCLCVSDVHAELLIPSPGRTRQIAVGANVGLYMWHVSDWEKMNVRGCACADMCLGACVHVCVFVCEGLVEGLQDKNLLLLRGSFISMPTQTWLCSRFWSLLTRCCVVSKDCASETKSC